MGGMLVGIIVGINAVELVMHREGMVELVVELGQERWRMIGVYVNGDIVKKLGSIRERVENDKEKLRTIVGGDFNARIGVKGGRCRRGEWEEEGRSKESKDKKINAEGRFLLEWVEEIGWEIFNGCMEGDEHGDWTNRLYNERC